MSKKFLSCLVEFEKKRVPPCCHKTIQDLFLTRRREISKRLDLFSTRRRGFFRWFFGSTFSSSLRAILLVLYGDRWTQKKIAHTSAVRTIHMFDLCQKRIRRVTFCRPLSRRRLSLASLRGGPSGRTISPTSLPRRHRSHLCQRRGRKSTHSC